MPHFRQYQEVGSLLGKTLAFSSSEEQRRYNRMKQRREQTLRRCQSD
jgi:hypothetical protein